MTRLASVSSIDLNKNSSPNYNDAYNDLIGKY